MLHGASSSPSYRESQLGELGVRLAVLSHQKPHRWSSGVTPLNLKGRSYAVRTI